MKQNLLIFSLLLFIILTGCAKTNIPLEQYDFNENLGSNSLLDLSTNKLASFFVTNLENDTKWRSKWDTISQLGVISFDSIKVIRTDSNKWCYLLPVLKQDSLVGLVIAGIDENETCEYESYKIRLSSETKLLLPELITSSDEAFYGLGVYFKSYKKANYIHYPLRTRSFREGEYFLFSYELGFHSYISGGEVIVSGGSTGNIRYALDYFRFIGYPIGKDYSIGNGRLGIYFYYWDMNMSYDDLSMDAYSFGETLDNWLWCNGYEVRVYPLFLPGFGGGGGSTGGSTGGGSTGGGSGSGGSGSGSGSVTPPPTNPKVCSHEICRYCSKPISSNNRNIDCPVSHSEYCSCIGSIEVKLTVNKSTLDLGDPLNIDVSVLNSKSAVSSVDYIIRNNSIEQSFDYFSPNPPMSYSTIVRSPGVYYLRVGINVDGDYRTIYSDEVMIAVHYPSREKIMNQACVIQGINTSWDKTLNSADVNGVQEYGGVVMINTREDNTGNMYEYIEKIGNKTPYSSLVASVLLNYEDKDFGPIGGGEYCVLIFHTHPPLWHYNGSIYLERPLGPSVPDTRDHTTIPAVVKDFSHASGKIDSKMKDSEYMNSVTLYNYGVDRRKL